MKSFGKDGEAKALAFDDQIKQNLAAANAHTPTLAELANSYFEAKQNSLDRITQKAMVNYLTKACASFLEKPCDKINKRDLETMRLSMGNVKNATRNKAQAYLIAMFNWGISQELLVRNPWHGAPKLKEEDHVVTATLDDFKTIMGHAAPHLKWAFEVSLCLALRPGEVELLRLKWSSFKWQSGCVEIIQGKGAGRKTVYPPESFMKKARSRYEQDKSANIPWVVHFRGRQIKSLKRAWGSAKERAGYGDSSIRMYDLRHVAATEMLANGADPAAVQHQLGHRRLSTTLDVYGGVMKTAQQKAAKLMPTLDDEPEDQ